MHKERKKLIVVYRALHAHFGPRHWWPAETPFEVMVGAILTQNTAWPNAEKAIINLKRKNLLSPPKILSVDKRKLKSLIRPSGFYNEKAKKLKAFVQFLYETCNGRINGLRLLRTKALRNKLLEVKGIGEETADSILLYALGRPIFVVDAYTRRMLLRHDLISENATYAEIQKFFTERLPRSRKLFNEYHALIVEIGKNYCRKKKPLCEECPVRRTIGKETVLKTGHKGRKCGILDRKNRR